MDCETEKVARFNAGGFMVEWNKSRSDDFEFSIDGRPVEIIDRKLAMLDKDVNENEILKLYWVVGRFIDDNTYAVARFATAPLESAATLPNVIKPTITAKLIWTAKELAQARRRQLPPTEIDWRERTGAC